MDADSPSRLSDQRRASTIDRISGRWKLLPPLARGDGSLWAGSRPVGRECPPPDGAAIIHLASRGWTPGHHL